MIAKQAALVTNGEVGLIKNPEHVARAIKGDVRGILSTEQSKLYAEMEKEDEAKKKLEDKTPAHKKGRFNPVNPDGTPKITKFAKGRWWTKVNGSWPAGSELCHKCDEEGTSQFKF